MQASSQYKVLIQPALSGHQIQHSCVRDRIPPTQHEAENSKIAQLCNCSISSAVAQLTFILCISRSFSFFQPLPCCNFLLFQECSLKKWLKKVASDTFCCGCWLLTGRADRGDSGTILSGGGVVSTVLLLWSEVTTAAFCLMLVNHTTEVPLEGHTDVRS